MRGTRWPFINPTHRVCQLKVNPPPDFHSLQLNTLLGGHYEAAGEGACEGGWSLTYADQLSSDPVSCFRFPGLLTKRETLTACIILDSHRAIINSYGDVNVDFILYEVGVLL